MGIMTLNQAIHTLAGPASNGDYNGKGRRDWRP